MLPRASPDRRPPPCPPPSRADPDPPPTHRPPGVSRRSLRPGASSEAEPVRPGSGFFQGKAASGLTSGRDFRPAVPSGAFPGRLPAPPPQLPSSERLRPGGPGGTGSRGRELQVKRRWMHRVQPKSTQERGGKRHLDPMGQQRKMGLPPKCLAVQLAYGSQLLFLMKLK